MEVENRIIEKLKSKKIRAMESPVIIMNEDDFEDLKSSVESKSTIMIGEVPTYGGIPLKTSYLINKGSVIVYDDIWRLYGR